MSLIHGTVVDASSLANESEASVASSTSPRRRGASRPWVSPIAACSLVLVGVLGACAGSPPPLAANPDLLDPSNTDLAACVATTRNVPMDSLLPSGAAPEGEMLRISRELPGGFTSVETDDDGGLILQMVDTLKASVVREALAIHLSQTQTGPLPQMRERLAAARLQPVPWSLAQLYDWNRYLSSLVLPAAAQQHMAVFGSGVSTQHARVEIDLEGEAAKAWVNTLLAPARVPCGLVHLNSVSTAPTKS